MTRAFHGTGEQAIEWGLRHASLELDVFLRQWNEGNAEKEWPEFYVWLDKQPRLVQYPTEDAYMRVCRALHWQTAHLRAHGIEPEAIAHDAPHDPPDDHVFDSIRIRDRVPSEAAIAVGEHAFRAGYQAAVDEKVEGGYFAPRHLHFENMAWDKYDPPEEIKALL